MELLVSLLGWYMESLTHDSGPLVARKLSSALATFFLRFHRVWRQFVRHLIHCFLSGQSYALLDGEGLQEPAANMSNLQPLQVQAVLSVLCNVLDDVTKVDLNAANK